VLAEGTLRRLVGTAGIMDTQLERLLAATSAGGVVIQVLPFSAGDQPGADGPISVVASRPRGVAVRDSKDTPGPVLGFPHEAGLGFVAGLKR
jgi:hypothetical protein